MERDSAKRVGWQGLEMVPGMQKIRIAIGLGSTVFYCNTIIARSHTAVKVSSMPARGLLPDSVGRRLFVPSSTRKGPRLRQKRAKPRYERFDATFFQI
jgi:hypothetical protein